MPLAATAKFKFDPLGILKSKWAHDMAHRFVVARIITLRRTRLPYPYDGMIHHPLSR